MKMRQGSQHNGINTWLFCATMLLLPFALLLVKLETSSSLPQHALAQTVQPVPAEPVNVGKLTPLRCQQQRSGGLTVVVKLTNTTRQTLPKGTRVYWQTQTGITDWITINNERGLPPKGVLMGIHSDWMKGGPCTAHYFKQIGTKPMSQNTLASDAHNTRKTNTPHVAYQSAAP